MSKIDLPISKPIITRQVSDITIFIRLKYPNWNTVSKILTLVPETFLEGFKDRLFCFTGRDTLLFQHLGEQEKMMSSKQGKRP